MFTVIDRLAVSRVRRIAGRIARRIARRGGLIGVCLVGVGLLGVVAGCGSEEQGGLQAASPGPDAVVGGEIDEIELLFDDLVAEAVGAVLGPDGEPLDADVVIDSQIRVLIELAEPLAEPGEYTVRSTIVSAVGSGVDESYVFTFEPDAPPPQLVFPPEDSGSPWLLWTVAVVGAVLVLVLIARLFVSMRRLRTPSRSRPT